MREIFKYLKQKQKLTKPNIVIICLILYKKYYEKKIKN